MRCAVRLSTMEADADFVQHLRTANDAIDTRQVESCELLLRWARGGEEGRRGADRAVRARLLREWGLDGGGDT